jgi:hypothetical protein
MIFQALPLGVDGRVAAHGRVHGAALGQDVRPKLMRDADEIERETEVVGIVDLDHLLERRPIDALRRQRIHETLEVACKRDRVGRRAGHHEGPLGGEPEFPPVDPLRPGLDEPRQDEPPLERRDRGLQVRRGRCAPRPAVLVSVAERHDARQNEAASA